MGAKLLVAAYVTGFVLIILAIGSMFLSRQFIHSYLASSIRLDPSTEIYKSWLKPSTPVYLKIYLYNLTNPFEFETSGAKPVLKEIGPFVYREVITKENISFSSDKILLTYNLKRNYYFEKDLSVEDDQTALITTLNMAPISIINQIKYSSPLVHNLVNQAFTLSEQTLKITKSVRELIFGYKDRFLTMLQFLDSKLVPCEFTSMLPVSKNDSTETYKILTGNYDINDIGKVVEYNGQLTLNYWSSNYANMINGTDGSLASPFLEKNDQVYFFKPEYCRSLKTTYKESIQVEKDIELYGYTLDESVFANGSVNLDNGGFCTPVGNCLPSGVLNISNCLNHMPIIISNPHFLFADTKFARDVMVLQENQMDDVTKYRTIVYIEPQTGVPMKGNKRIQMNTQLFRDPRIKITKNLPEILYPLFWIDESFEASSDQLKNFYYEVNFPIKAIYYGKYILLGLGSATLLACAAYSLMVYIKYRRYVKMSQSTSSTNEHSPLLINGSN